MFLHQIHSGTDVYGVGLQPDPGRVSLKFAQNSIKNELTADLFPLNQKNKREKYNVKFKHR